MYYPWNIGGLSTYPAIDIIGDTFVEITSGMDTGVSLKVKLPAGLVAAGIVASGLVVAGIAGSVPRLGIYGLISSSYLMQNNP